MATRNDVEEAIKAIETDGNNTAAEVRDVLTKLLDYTENEEQAESNLRPFAFKSDKEIQSNGNTLNYSFRGFEKHSTHLTFVLKIIKPSKNNAYSFPYDAEHKDQLISILKEITNRNLTLNFTIPVILTFENVENENENGGQTKQSHFSFNVQITLINKAEGITFDFFGYANASEFNLQENKNFRSMETTTSIVFHVPK